MSKLTLCVAAMMVIGMAASSPTSALAQTRAVETPKAAGIEPDEIDSKQKARAETAPRPATSTPPARTKPATAPPAAPGTKLSAGAAGTGPQKYETAECGTPEKPITCCTQGSGPGASCNLFILLCNEGGGTGKGDGGDAICVH